MVDVAKDGLGAEAVGDVLGVDVLAELVDDLQRSLLLGVDLTLKRESVN